ncbi:MAG: efflux RND transporter periplasmic adaptor subunit [bacterium]|jgi:RND family efflux transporter MFP subunit
MKKRIGIIIILVLLAGFGVVRGMARPGTPAAGAEDEAAAGVPVTVEPAARRTVSLTVTLSGKLAADKDVMVLPKMPGKVLRTPVKVGDHIRAGELLVALDPADVDRQVEQAAAALQMAEAGYSLTRQNIENAQTNLARLQALYAEGAISQAELEQAEMMASPANLATAEAQLNQAKVAYEQAAELRADMNITAPVSGYVSLLNATPGAMVSSAQPVAAVVDIDKVYADVAVSENIVNVLSPGRDVGVVVPAAADAPFAGKIDSIGPAADMRTQLYPVRIVVGNPDHVLKPGMFARMEFYTDVREDVIAVPSEAVLMKDGKTVVFVALDGAAAERVVTTGLDEGNYVEITAGLEPEEMVIVKGQDYVSDGEKVRVVGGN